PTDTSAPAGEGAGDGAPAAVAELSPYHGGTTLEPEPLRTRAPGVAHPRVSDEVPAGLIHDDLLEERVCKKMLNSLKQVNIHHKVTSFRMICSRIFYFIDVLVMTSLVWVVQKMAMRSRVKSSILSVMSERLQQVPALKQE